MVQATPPIGAKMQEMVSETAFPGQSSGETTLGRTGHCASQGGILILSSWIFVFPQHIYNLVDAINNTDR